MDIYVLFERISKRPRAKCDELVSELQWGVGVRRGVRTFSNYTLPSCPLLFIAAFQNHCSDNRKLEPGAQPPFTFV